MAITLVTTVAGETSNSYASLVYSTDYWSGHYSSSKAALWAALSDEQKRRALVTACRVLERCKFTLNLRRQESDDRRWTLTHTNGLLNETYSIITPMRMDVNQALQFPRNCDYTSSGVPYVPTEIIDAQCEQALYLLSVDESSISSQLQGVGSESVQAGSISTSQDFSRVGTLLAPMAYELIAPYLLRSSSFRRS